MSRRTRCRRAEANYGPEIGTTYLLHFCDPQTGEPARYKHAGHYIGWTQDLAARLDAHARGTGARLIEVITKAGLGFRLVRTWPGTTRDREDLLKHAGGGRRYCPECGVTPRQGTGPLTPVRRLSLYELERAGTSLDGTPLPDTSPTWPIPAAHGKDADMFGRARRAVARDHAQQQARAQAEADTLYAEAGRLDDLTGQPHGYRQQITAGRAARIRELLGPDLIRDARDAAGEPRLQGADLDAELDRLAEVFPEDIPSESIPRADRPEPEGGRRPAESQSANHQIEADRLAAQMRPERSPAARADYYRSPPGSAGHRAAYGQMHAAADGIGFADADPDVSYEIDNDGELAAERYYEELAGRHYGEVGEHDAGADEPGPDAARWVPGQEKDQIQAAGDLLSEHAARAGDALRRERRATAGERLAQLAHDEDTLAQARQAAADARADRQTATTGAYAAAARMQRQALDDAVRDAPDHLYGSPGCAEADPETAHCGSPAPEPQDAGRFPLPRILPASEVSPVRAPVAATLPDGIPHADPFLAGRGWQAHGGIYVRQPQAQVEAG
jgi:hypothetical protein